ncbi:unnamed protein product [Mycena citricolor]|uniref:Glycolipid transfer protein domain-containing protein n=1 Tax=Mycena citricolor TaxID=2018698 RepID=A0AAD2I0B8_9AGAR|nr:unnamed protein product [Mycena citricolor]
MAPHFETVKVFFRRCGTKGSDEVDTEGFLLASDGLVDMFDLLGAGVFSFVQIDLRNNIAGVRQRYESHASNSTSLEDLGSGIHVPRAPEDAVRTVLRLACVFSARLRCRSQAPSHFPRALCGDCKPSVSQSTSRLCGCMCVIQIAIRAVPRRDQFYAALCQGEDREKFEQELRRWLDGLEGIVKQTKLFLEDGGYGRV